LNLSAIENFSPMVSTVKIEGQIAFRIKEGSLKRTNFIAFLESHLLRQTFFCWKLGKILKR